MLDLRLVGYLILACLKMGILKLDSLDTGYRMLIIRLGDEPGEDFSKDSLD